jgi:hypothetical protein
MRRYGQRVFVRLHSPGERSAGIMRVRWRRAPVGSLFVLSLLVVSLFASGAARQAAPSGSQRIAVRGTVVNSVTREPVARALVYSPDKRFATLTDDQGRFEFAISLETAAPPPDQHDTSAVETESYSGPLRSSTNFPTILMARKPGFLEWDRHPQTWQPSPVLPGKDVMIALVPEARIVGRVILPSSNASDRITVHLYRRQILEGRGHWTLAGSVEARLSGEFRFSDLEAGTYKLLTGELMDRDPLTFDPRGPMYGYPPAYFPNATDFQTAGAFPLTAGSTFQAELSPVRQPYYPIKVPVTNGPIDNQIEVSVSVHGRKGPGFTLGYNRREQRIEGGLPNGTYLVEATDNGGIGLSGSVNLVVKDGAAETAPMTLMPNSSVHIKAKLDFKSSSEIDAFNEDPDQNFWQEGRVRAENFTVSLQPVDEFTASDMSGRPRSVTQQPDSVVFGGIRPGRYWVRVDPHRGFAASVTSGEIDLLHHPLTIVHGESIGVNVTLRDDGAEVFGGVVGLDESAEAPASATGVTGGFGTMASAHVYCLPLPDSTGQFRHATVWRDGKFDLRQVPPGSYRVLAFDRPQKELEYSSGEAMRVYDGKGQVVRIGAGQKEQITLQLISTSE